MSSSRVTTPERELMEPKSWNRIAIAVALLAVSAFAATTYHLASTYKFGAAKGGREYFDYMTFDSGSRRLYLSHGTEVLVVNADSGKEEGKISALMLKQTGDNIALVNEQTINLHRRQMQAEVELDNVRTEAEIKKMENQNRIAVLRAQSEQAEMFTRLGTGIIQALFDGRAPEGCRSCD